jgi:hypothetical protein
MKKSSRLWWLHGAILLSAAIGCKNCGSQQGCGPGGGSGGAPATGLYGSAGGQAYSQTTPGMGSMGAAQGVPSGGAFSSSTNSAYAPPAMSSSVSGLSPNMSGMSGMSGVR